MRLLAGCGIISSVIVAVFQSSLGRWPTWPDRIALSVRPRRAIEAENLALRRQLALFFKERGMEPAHRRRRRARA